MCIECVNINMSFHYYYLIAQVSNVNIYQNLERDRQLSDSATSPIHNTEIHVLLRFSFLKILIMFVSTVNVFF